jgi:CshA-type fibril repeat protein
VPEDSLFADPLLDDFPGRSADGRLGALVLDTVRFPATGQPAGATVGNGGRTLSIPARGSLPSFSVSAGPENGLIGVTPGTSFHGTTPVVAYEVLSDVADSTGVVSRQYTRSTIQVTITGGDIVTTDDHVTVRSGVTASLPGASNDSPAPGFFPFSFDEMSFPATGQPPGSRIVDDEHGHDHEYSLVVPDEGVWRISGGGYMSFKPDAGFVGTTSPVRYTIFDFAFLHFGTGTETVTVLAPAVPKADTAQTPQGVAVVVHTLANDTPELDPNGAPYDNADKVTFDPARRPSGSTLTAGSGNKQLVVPGQGTYTIDYGTGDVAYVPDPKFRGSASAFYLLVPGGGSRFQVVVADVDPLLNADYATTTAGTSKRVRVLVNDTPGTPVRPLVPGSVRLTADLLSHPPATTSADGQTVTLPGRGVYAVAGDGNVTFYPLPGTRGVSYVGYSALDANGTKAYAALSVRVG